MVEDTWVSCRNLSAKELALHHLLAIYYIPNLTLHMAGFMSLPTELRLQIYRELFISKPRVSRMGQRVRGPVTCYNDRTFHVAILEVNKQFHEEATSILYGESAWTLRIYLIFKENKIHGSSLDSALHSLTSSKQFSYIRTCILDVRLFRGESEENDTTFSDIDVLYANVKIVRQVLSRASGLIEIEVSWRNYFNLDLAEIRRRSLKPLDQLPIAYKLSIGKVNNTLEGSNNDLTYWPDMLKAFRVMLFRGSLLSVVNR